MSLTSANVILTLSQAILFPQSQRIQGFASDDMTNIEPARILESLMGIDGNLSFGFIYTERRQSITLQANSASNNAS